MVRPEDILKQRRRSATRQKGAPLLEFVLMLPAVLSVIFAIVGYSTIFMLQHTLSSAVSQGARAVAVAGSNATAESAARQLLSSSLPAGLYPNGFSFTTTPLAGATDCGAALAAGTNPNLSCMRFEGTFTTANNSFISNIPFSDNLFPSQLTASAVVLYQNSE